MVRGWLPASLSKIALSGVTRYSHPVVPAWVTVTGFPATVIVAVRLALPGLALRSSRKEKKTLVPGGPSQYTALVEFLFPYQLDHKRETRKFSFQPGRYFSESEESAKCEERN